jgi:hypothetical protein
LEGIDANLVWSVQVVPWFRVKRRHVAGGAFAFAFEHDFPALGSGFVVTSRRRLRRRDRQLVKMKRGQLGGELVGFATGVIGTTLGPMLTGDTLTLCCGGRLIASGARLSTSSTLSQTWTAMLLLS